MQREEKVELPRPVRAEHDRSVRKGGVLKVARDPRQGSAGSGQRKKKAAATSGRRGYQLAK